MAAPLGNQFWKNRSEHGRDFLFAKAPLLKTEISKYFNWLDAHPWYKVEAIKSGEMAGKLIKVPTARPYTLSGLCIYLNASESWWKNFRKNDNLTEDFLSVISWAEDVIRTQKFEGAAVGAFNANIISRDLGLADQLNSRQVDKNGNDVDQSPSKIILIQRRAGQDIDDEDLEIKESED